MKQYKVKDIRIALRDKLHKQDFVTDKTGVKTIELMGTSFIADEDAIFGQVNWDYVERELEWYKSMSLNVNDIPGGVKQETNPPQIWMSVADPDGLINSNYGWAIWHEDNCEQYEHCVAELKKNRDSRRAIMIYTRPQMWYDYNKNGRSDFMCTNSVQYLVRNDKVHAVVQMRSNDAIFGYKNDRAWQEHVLNKVAQDTGYAQGDIIWNAGSLHIYSRHFGLVE
jgi:thymidylate synthase